MRSAPRPTCAMNNYAGHRLSPWLGHIMVSRQETARPLLTPGEVMQLPPAMNRSSSPAFLRSGPGRPGITRIGALRAASYLHPCCPTRATPAADTSPKPTTGHRFLTRTQTRQQRTSRLSALLAAAAHHRTKGVPRSLG